MYKEQKIRKILGDLSADNKFDLFLREIGERILFSFTILEELKGDISAKRLQELNEKAHSPLLEASYEQKLLNPTKAVEEFGIDFGQFVSAYSYKVYLLFREAFKGNSLALERQADLWLEVRYAGKDGFIKLLKERWSESRLDLAENMYKESYGAGRDLFTNVALEAKSSDLSYLYRYGVMISENDVNTASFINSLPQKDIKLIVDTMVEAYIEGFRESGMDYTIKNTVSLILQAGYERIVPGLIVGFGNYGFRLFIRHVNGTKFNRQANYDHRFDYALSISEKSVEDNISVTKEVLIKLAEILKGYSGTAYLDVFGEPAFSPVLKAEACKASEEASALFNKQGQTLRAIANEYMPGDETSFEMIAFPSPEIEGDFEEIFKDTVRLNTLSNDIYRPIQQAIIDAMDGAEYVHITGSGTNETDLKVALWPISDPTKETIFENCLASVNIPLGEVFTSPKLSGTNGLLHVEESFLRGLRFDNIRLKFKDGYVSDWSCDNFDTAEEGKDYIRENLFFPHKTLPLGEFAIGTNTVVYEMALKHKIMGLLPILILEKMGPHFAVGDTCFTWSEDSEKPDPITGKTMIATDNEKSILRKEDVSKAYTNKHTDVTLPYNSLDTISVTHPDGREVVIIKGGRFVLKGTELLNEAIDKAHTYL